MQKGFPGRPWQVRQTLLEVNLGLLKKNYLKLKKTAGSAELMVLLKSDAYGHSHEEVALTLDSLAKSSGLHGFGVANVEEGIELRRIKIKRPVYILSGIQQVDEDLLRCLDTCRLTPVISSLSVLKQFQKESSRRRKPLTVHLKFNTGMNRLGIDVFELEEVLHILEKAKGLKVEGIMSHFSSAENPKATLTKKQCEIFRKIIGAFSQAGRMPSLVHMENSYGLQNHLLPEANLARVGLHLYGVGNKELQPISQWTAQVYQVRDLKKGDAVGYGPLYKAKRNMRMAILGVGYGDGYHRIFSNRAEVLLHGKRCPVIGAVSMDLTAVDVSKVPEISTKSRAVLMGSDGKEQITAEELAGHAGCIPWEILTGISARVPRVFRHE